MRTFYLPTRPYSVIDCINRVSLATGSIGNAERGADVDYNGHHVYFVEPNQFKRYWTCGYTWAGSHTIGRGSLAECLEAAKREYDRGEGRPLVLESPTRDRVVSFAAGRHQPLGDRMSTKHNLTTIIDSTKLKNIDSWLGPKQGDVPVADVDDYIASEQIAKESDPPGSVKAVAKARVRVLEHAHGMLDLADSIDERLKSSEHLKPAKRAAFAFVAAWLRKSAAAQ